MFRVEVKSPGFSRGPFVRVDFTGHLIDYSQLSGAVGLLTNCFDFDTKISLNLSFSPKTE